MAVNVFTDFISNESLTNQVINGKSTGFAVNIKIPFYRSLALSCIEKLELKVDGEEVKENNIVFAVNGKKFLLSELKDLFAEWWFVHDRATLFAERKDGLSTGNHEVEVTITLRGPYMNYHGDKYLTFTEVSSKILSVT